MNCCANLHRTSHAGMASAYACDGCGQVTTAVRGPGGATVFVDGVGFEWWGAVPFEVHSDE